jgi:hypothetical protein
MKLSGKIPNRSVLPHIHVHAYLKLSSFLEVWLTALQLCVKLREAAVIALAHFAV